MKQSKYRDYNIVFCNGRRVMDETIKGRKVISLYELVTEYNNSVVIVSSRTHSDAMIRQLFQNDFPMDQVLMPGEKRLIEGWCGTTYFDFWDPKDHEVFLDIGAFDGKTSYLFSEWCHGSYDKIFAFEANPNQLHICRHNADQWKLNNFCLVGKGAWSCQTTKKFHSGAAGGASIGKDGDCAIEVDRIDNIVKNERVTLIKMDIEGSEYEALVGAEETIKKWTPRLAISIYHRPEDILKIPEYLHQLCPEYKFAIRHYTNYLWDTVLYAWV